MRMPPPLLEVLCIEAQGTEICKRRSRRICHACLIAQQSLTPTIAPSATLIGLLADEQRLRVFAAIALGARTIEAAAAASATDLATVQTVLPRLVSAGLVEQRDGLHVSLEALRAAARDRPLRRRDLPGATSEQQRVLRNFVERGRLIRLPARHAQRRVILEYVAGLFDEGRQYPEAEVNELLNSLHDDHAALRRHLVDERLLERTGGVYRRA
jgi:hypothetical protein